jgi:hypothetical protein
MGSVTKISDYKKRAAVIINGRDMKRRIDKDFLEKIFGDIDDLESGTDDEVLKDLENMGIDIEKAKTKFEETICQYLKDKKIIKDDREAKNES